MENSIIQIENLNCKVGYRYLLRDINWCVERGEHWVVFGMNGSGKTTLLSIIAGFKYYSQGTVKVFGQTFNNDNILQIRKKIGWVSSSFFDKYYSKESALHIVLSGLNGTLGLHDAITLDDVRLAKTLLSELGLGDKVNHTFDMFSKGERQNILIARALINSPEILILDEPCTGLDVYYRSCLFYVIEELSRKKNLTIIYVTHYMEEITPLFTKTMLLKDGFVFAQGMTEKILSEEIICSFLGYPVEIQKQEGRYQLKVNAKTNLVKFLK